MISRTPFILAATQLLAPTYGIVQAAQIAALLYALRNALYAGASYPIGALSDRFGRRGLLLLGYLLGAVVTSGFAAAFYFGASGLPLLVLLFALAGLYIAAEDALEGALTADLVPDETIRGTAFGVLGTVNGIGDFLASALVGLLWSFSPVIGFCYAAAMMLLGGVFLRRVR